MSNAAHAIVSRLLEMGPHRRIPVKVRKPDGSVVDAEFTGYWDWPGKGPRHSIGYPSPSGGFSHGVLHGDDRLETPVPNPDEWEAERQEHARQQAAKAANPPAKAAFWPTGGSGA